MASSHTGKWEGGPSRWAGRVACVLVVPPGRQVRAPGPRSRRCGGRPQGDTGAPPPLRGLDWTALTLDGGAVSPRIARDCEAISPGLPLAIPKGRHRLWFMV
jgi:hypothetical protein